MPNGLARGVTGTPADRRDDRRAREARTRGGELGGAGAGRSAERTRTHSAPASKGPQTRAEDEAGTDRSVGRMRSGDGVPNGAPTAGSGAAVLPLSPLPGAPGGAGTGLPLLRVRGGRAGLGGAAGGRAFFVFLAAAGRGRSLAWLLGSPGRPDS